MKIEESLANTLIELAELNPKYCISEDLVFQYVEDEGLGLQETSRVIRFLENKDISIVSPAAYDVAVAQSQSCSQYEHTQLSTVDEIIVAFKQLPIEEQNWCVNELLKLVKPKQESCNSSEKDRFLNKIRKLNLQYSYIAVLLISYLDNCNIDGDADFTAVVHSFWGFYTNRQKKQ